MPNPPLVTGCYYHIYNRGVEKRKIFLHEKDYGRFLESVNFYRFSPQPIRLSEFKRNRKALKRVAQKAIVEIVCFCLMPNHFHFLIRQLEDGGITEFIRKTSDSYSRFFNTKYERVGGLFQGNFKAKLVESDEYLLELTKYIHLNPRGINNLPPEAYPYSSIKSYLLAEQTEFCNPEFVLSYFSKTNYANSYADYLETTDARVLESLIINGITIDHE